MAVGVSPMEIGVLAQGQIKLGIAEQARRFEREAHRLVRATLNMGGRRFRSRMVKERLSGPPGVNRKTGTLERSLFVKPFRQGDTYQLVAAMGYGNKAPYAEKLERWGRLKFRETFEREVPKIEDDVRLALNALVRVSGRALPGAILTEADQSALVTFERAARSRGFKRYSDSLDLKTGAIIPYQKPRRRDRR